MRAIPSERLAMLLLALLIVGASSTIAARTARAQEVEDEPAEGEAAEATPAADVRPDISTPQRAIATFLAAVRDADWDVSAAVLDLREVPTAQRAYVGREASHDLAAILEAEGVVPAMLPDEQDPGNERAIEVARLEGASRGIVIRRLYTDGNVEWRFSPATVQIAHELHGLLHPGPLGAFVPAALREPRVLGLEPWQWLALPVALIIALGGALLLSRVTTSLSRKVTRRLTPERAEWFSVLLPRLRRPVQGAYALALMGLTAVLIRFPSSLMGVLGHAYNVAWALVVGWALWLIVDFAAERVEEHAAHQDDWRGRRARTRAGALRRVMHVLVVAGAVIAVLSQIGPVREFGSSLLASAGVAGIILGIAAQRTLGNLIAGIQLSLTQPLRVGDEVSVQGQTGRVEEITLTYVVLRLVDQRRLMLPIGQLLEMPFENWTRRGTELRGAVMIPIDALTPVDELRAQLARFVRAHPLFDGVSFDVRVLELLNLTAVLRVRVSAADSDKLFELECDVREFALEVLRETQGERDTGIRARLATEDALAARTK